MKKTTPKRVREKGEGAAESSKEEEEEEEEDKWVAQRIKTEFGVTDDVITLNNGQTYHFFKLPHKVQFLFSRPAASPSPSLCPSVLPSLPPFLPPSLPPALPT